MKYSPMKIVRPLREMHLYVFQKRQYVAYNREYHRYIIRKRVDRVPITPRYIYIYFFFQLHSIPLYGCRTALPKHRSEFNALY